MGIEIRNIINVKNPTPIKIAVYIKNIFKSCTGWDVNQFRVSTNSVAIGFNFITNYISKENISFLETGNYTIKYMTYDWTINDGS